MKTKVLPFAFMALMIALMLQSCQKNYEEQYSARTLKSEVFADYLLNSNLDVVFEDQVVRGTGKPEFELLPIGSINLLDYEDCFILNVASGGNGSEPVASAIIRFQGEVLLNTSDFSNTEEQHTLQICNLTDESVLEVEVRGAPGSTLNIWIEGVMNSFLDARDGRRYSVVHIGDQVWMAENLAWLPAVSPNSIVSLTDPHYYVFGYAGTDVDEAKSQANYTSYGVLYNWPAAMISSPEGWHLAGDNEYKQMEMALGMSQADADATANRGTDEGTQMKSTSGWLADGNGTNTSGFNALPAGIMNSLSLTFFGTGAFANYWTSTEATDSPTNAWTRRLVNVSPQVARSTIPVKSFGFSVRCVRD